MSITRRACALALVSLASLSACSDSGPVGREDTSQLSSQASVALFGELMSAAFSAWASAGTGASSTAPAAAETFTHTAPCANGGSVTVSGTFTDNVNSSGNGTISYNMTQTPSSCQVTTSSGNFTMSGDPNVTIAMSYPVSNWQAAGELSWTMKGGFRYGGESTGSCRVDMTYRMNPQTARGSMSGSICGNRIDQSF